VKKESVTYSEAQKRRISQGTLQNLYHLQEAEIECRKKLAGTKFENTTIQAINNLLDIRGQNFKDMLTRTYYWMDHVYVLILE
jgi:hypothetical protein